MVPQLFVATTVLTVSVCGSPTCDTHLHVQMAMKMSESEYVYWRAKKAYEADAARREAEAKVSGEVILRQPLR